MARSGSLYVWKFERRGRQVNVWGNDQPIDNTSPPQCMAVIAAVGENTDVQGEVLGLKVGASEAEPYWTESAAGIPRALPWQDAANCPVDTGL